MNKIPEIGSTWRHPETGHLYGVILIANENRDPERKSDYPITIVYKRIADETFWAVSEDQWPGSKIPSS